MATLKIDPEFEALIPPLSPDEYKQLEENIVEAGMCYDPIITWDGVIIDGHNRWKIIQEHPEITYKTYAEVFLNRNEAKLWIINNQLGRRNLEKSDAIDLAEKRAEVTAQIAKEKQAEAGKTFGVGMPKKDEIASVQMDKSYSEPINTREEIAKTAGVSTGTVARYQEVKKKAPELVPKIKSGEMTIGGAYKAMKDEERTPEPSKPVEPHERIEPLKYTIDNLLKEVGASGENYVRFLRETLMMHNTLYEGQDEKSKVREEVAKIKSRIEAIENLLK